MVNRNFERPWSGHKPAKEPCVPCNNTGCLIVETPQRIEVQRCDTCKRFKDDRSAWRSLQPKNKKGRNNKRRP